MGKSTAMWGKTSGKVGGLVYATSGGETIVREYNPNVSNPNTSAQVDQRARLKLMSQLSAALAPSIVMQKEGLVSKRNKFTQRNFGSCYASDGVAQITYENVQLTEGNLGLPQVSAQVTVVGNDRNLFTYFETNPSASISRVVYSVYLKTEESKLSFVDSFIASTRATTQGQNTYYFMGMLPKMPAGELVIYAYGMIDTSERATAQYGELSVNDGTDIARLVATRAINYTDYQFTQTRGATMGADNQPVEPTPAGSVRVYATALGNGGSVTGAGTYEIGASVTLTATANDGYQFSKWVKNGTSETVSTSNPYTFNAAEQVDLVAVFEVQGGGGGL